MKQEVAIQSKDYTGILVLERRKDAGPGVHFVPPGLLQLKVLRHRLRPYDPATVCPECGCTFGAWRSTLRPHHACAIRAALASGSTSGGFQYGHPVLPVTFTIFTLPYCIIVWLHFANQFLPRDAL